MKLADGQEKIRSFAPMKAMWIWIVWMLWIMACSRRNSVGTYSRATADDGFPVAHSFEQIPFTQIIDVPELSADAENCTYAEIDRIGGVVDFDFRIWPIFNVADIAICIGVACIAFYFLET